MEKAVVRGVRVAGMDGGGKGVRRNEVVVVVVE